METYFTTKGLSEYLKIPEQTIRRWVMNNEIYYIRIHNVIRYRLSEIEAWIDENKEKLPSVQEGGKEKDLFSETEEGETGKGDEETKQTGTVKDNGPLNCTTGDKEKENVA